MEKKQDRTISLKNIAIYKSDNHNKMFSRKLVGKILLKPKGKGNYIDKLVSFRKDNISIAECYNINKPIIDYDSDASQWIKIGKRMSKMILIKIKGKNIIFNIKIMISEEKSKIFIEKNYFMTISTSDLDSNPWISNLFFAYDKKYNFLWYSRKDSLHSSNIRVNPNIAISIFDSNLINDKKIQAIYIKAKAFEVNNKLELIKDLFTYSKRLLKKEFLESKIEFEKFNSFYEDFLHSSVLRLYKAIPEKVWKWEKEESYNGKWMDKKVLISLK